jgi:hypothetical protein
MSRWYGPVTLDALIWLADRINERLAEADGVPWEMAQHDDPDLWMQNTHLIFIWLILQELELHYDLGWTPMLAKLEQMDDRLDGIDDRLDTANDWLETIAENTEAP